MQICAVETFIQVIQAEGQQFAFDLIPQIPRAFVIMTKDGGVLFSLKFQNTRLGIGVRFHRAVAIQMIGRDI